MQNIINREDTKIKLIGYLQRYNNITNNVKCIY